MDKRIFSLLLVCTIFIGACAGIDYDPRVAEEQRQARQKEFNRFVEENLPKPLQNFLSWESLEMVKSRAERCHMSDIDMYVDGCVVLAIQYNNKYRGDFGSFRCEFYKIRFNPVLAHTSFESQQLPHCGIESGMVTKDDLYVGYRR